MSSVLTPDYVMRAIAEAQRLVDERRPMLDEQVHALECEVAEKETAVRGLLQLIQKQGLSLLLEDEYQRTNHAWSVLAARLAVLKKEANQIEAPRLTEADVEAYLDDMRKVFQQGEIHARQELLRQFIRSCYIRTMSRSSTRLGCQPSLRWVVSEGLTAL